MNERDLGPKPTNPEHRPTPERIFDEMYRLLAAFGNHEAKALLLCAMRPGIIYTRSDLNNLLRQMQGENPGWTMTRKNKGAPFEYCQNSLSPIGLVAYKVADQQSNTYGYAITPYGQKQGQVLAGLLLDFSTEDPRHWLGDYFGQTSSNSKPGRTESGEEKDKKRAPGTRLKIFWELVTTHLPIREIDLMVGLGEKDNSTTSKHLNSLQERGIIGFQSVEHDQPFSIYGFNSDHPSIAVPAYKRRPKLTESIWQILTQHPQQTWTIEQMKTVYLEDRPEAANLQQDSLGKTIGRVLNHLYSQGFASRQRFSEEYRSEITLDDEQRTRLVKLLALIDGFQNQNPQILALGRARAEEMIADPLKTAKLMAKVREHSSHINPNASAQTQEDILAYLADNPDSTIRQIRQDLKRQKINLSAQRILALLIGLAREDKIVKEKRKGIIYVRLAA
ncbi:hypothetical protein HYT17_02015 [Candidatus Microgenomates bacterium]|nr:hypothetical protein [Candidatus Microgenomates bacterium]